MGQRYFIKVAIHYAAWKLVCGPLRMGGLVIHASSNWIGLLRSSITLEFLFKPMGMLKNA